MRDKRAVSINGENYTIYQLPPTKSVKLFTKLVKLLGGAGTNFSFTKQDYNKEPDVGKIIGNLLSGLTERLDESFMECLIDEVITAGFVFVAINGKEVPIDSSIYESHFTGKTANLLQLMYFVLEANYKDFLFETIGRIRGLLEGSEILQKIQEKQK